MPHVSAVITNLADELTLVDRMQDALSGEMVRRQELLRAAGNYASLRDYEKARTSGDRPDLAPLPSLLIVCDEFSELLSAKPEFVDLFVAIGRLGRSLGLHLLLASQRLEEGRLRGLTATCPTGSACARSRPASRAASSACRDAYELPAVPGLGFLKPDQSTLLRFKAAYVSGPPRAVARAAAGGRVGAARREILPFTPARCLAAGAGGGRRVPRRGGVRRRRRGGDSGPCSTSPSTGWPATAPRPTRSGCRRSTCPTPSTQLMPDLAADPELGLVSPLVARHAGRCGSRSAPSTGPASSAARCCASTSSGAAGHVAVVGGPPHRQVARCCAPSSPAWR